MGTSSGSLQISYCERSELASCGHTVAITLCGDHVKTSGVAELLEIYRRMTPAEREALLAYARMTPDKIAELKKSKDAIAKLHTTIEMLKIHLKREDGPNTPPSKKIAKEKRNKDKRKSSKENKKRPSKDAKPRKANHPGTTDNRRASTSNRAVFERCSCGSDQFIVTGTNTRTLDDILDVLTNIERFTEMKGQCMDCGAKAVGKLFKENAVDINTEDSDTVKPFEDGKEHSETIGSSKIDVTEIQDPIPSDVESKQDVPKGNVWAKTKSGIQVLLTEKAAAKQSDPVPDSIIRKGSIVKSSDTNGKTEVRIPKKGRMNFGILVMIAVLWGHRMTLGGVSEFMGWLCSFGYSPSTIMDALTRMGKGFKPFADEILDQLYKVHSVNIDETIFPVGKKLRYVWVITDGQSIYYFAHSRAVTKLVELFDGYDGVVVCDGYHTKSLFPKVQRCWAHILRVTKWGANFEKKYRDSTVAQSFHTEVRDLFHLALKKKLDGRGIESYDMILNKLRDIIKRYEQFPEISDAVVHVRNAADQAFTFMKYEHTPPTNNIAEQAMREIVKHRVMRVLFRTWEGIETFVTIMSVIETCKKRGIDIDSVVRKYL